MKATNSKTKPRFIRAEGWPAGHYEWLDDEPDEGMPGDTIAAAMCIAPIVASGWVPCAGCGGEPYGDFGHWVHTPPGKVYVYALCKACKGAVADESHATDDPNGVTQTRTAAGPVGKAIERALDEFIEAGEPKPEGWDESDAIGAKK